MVLNSRSGPVCGMILNQDVSGCVRCQTVVVLGDIDTKKRLVRYAENEIDSGPRRDSCGVTKGTSDELPPTKR